MTGHDLVKQLREIDSKKKPSMYRSIRDTDADLLLSIAEAFQPGDALICGLFAEFLEKHIPTGYLKDSGPGKDITNQDAANRMRRLQAAAERLESTP